MTENEREAVAELARLVGRLAVWNLRELGDSSVKSILSDVDRVLADLSSGPVSVKRSGE